MCQSSSGAALLYTSPACKPQKYVQGPLRDLHDVQSSILLGRPHIDCRGHRHRKLGFGGLLVDGKLLREQQLCVEGCQAHRLGVPLPVLARGVIVVLGLPDPQHLVAAAEDLEGALVGGHEELAAEGADLQDSRKSGQ